MLVSSQEQLSILKLAILAKIDLTIMSVLAQVQFYIRSRRFQPSNSMRSKVISSWKVQNGAQIDPQTDIIFLTLKYFSPLLYIYSRGQKKNT